MLSLGVSPTWTHAYSDFSAELQLKSEISTINCTVNEKAISLTMESHTMGHLSFMNTFITKNRFTHVSFSYFFLFLQDTKKP